MAYMLYCMDFNVIIARVNTTSMSPNTYYGIHIIPGI